MAKTGKKSPPRRKRILAWTLGVILGLIVLLAALLVGVVPPQSVEKFASPEETQAMMSAINKISGSLWSQDGKLAVQSTVELTPAEVSALLTTGIRAYQLQHSGAKDAVLAGKFADGKLQFAAGQPFWGKLAVNFSCSVVPGVADGKLRLAFSEVWAGRLPLPGMLVSRLAAGKLAQWEDTPEYQNAMAAILDLKVNDSGNLEMTFIPSQVAALLSLFMQR